MRLGGKGVRLRAFYKLEDRRRPRLLEVEQAVPVGRASPFDQYRIAAQAEGPDAGDPAGHVEHIAGVRVMKRGAQLFHSLRDLADLLFPDGGMLVRKAVDAARAVPLFLRGL